MNLPKIQLKPYPCPTKNLLLALPRGWGCSSLVEDLPSMWEALGAIRSTTKKIKEKERKASPAYKV